MDLQFILDPYATINYVNDYVTKSNVVASRLLRSLQEKLKEGDLDLMNKLRQIVNTFTNNSEISAQEVCLHLLGIAMHRSSVAQVFINTSPFEKRGQLLKSKSDLEVLHDIDPDSQDKFVPNLSCRYIQRPNILETVCLADFAAMYTFSKKKSEKIKQNENRNSEEEVEFSENEEEKNILGHSMATLQHNLPLKDKFGFLTIRKQRKIIRYCRYDRNIDGENYYREQLMLFTAWRIEPRLHMDLAKEYGRCLNEIKQSRPKYCQCDHILRI